MPVRRGALIVIVSLLAVAAGCSSDRVVVGLPQTHLLLMTTVPDSIPADGSDASQLTAIIVRVPDDGQDLGGIEVVFSTTLGGLAGTSETTRSTTTVSEGAAGTALRGTGVAGTATVTATVSSLQLEETREVELTAR